MHPPVTDYLGTISLNPLILDSFAGEHSDTLIVKEPFDTQYPKIKLFDHIFFTFRPELFVTYT